MSIPPLTVRPIVHTGHMTRYLELFGALGATVVTESEMWSEVAFGAGRIAVHGLLPATTEAEVALGFETPSVEGYAAALAGVTGPSVELHEADHGISVRVVGRDGLELLVDTRPDGPDGAPGTLVRQLWVSTDVAATADDLESLGLTRRMTNVNGRTIDLRAAEGGTLVHVAEGGAVGATYELDVTDLNAAHKALLDAGFEHDVIDETWGRTLKVALPGTETRLWVVQKDVDPVGVIRHS